MAMKNNPIKQDEISIEERFKNKLNNGNRYLAIEGVDCTGKGSISKYIESNIKIDGIKIERVEFPWYDSPSGEMIKSYLTGKYGDYSVLLTDIPYENPVEWFSLATSRYERLIKETSFVCTIYAINRIEYFKTHSIDPDTVYVFDRFSYSNMIHHFSNIYHFFTKGEGYNLSRIDWRKSEYYKKVSFTDYINQAVYTEARRFYGRNDKFEKAYDVPVPYSFLLRLPYEEVIERLSKRKEKISGDILEKTEALKRATEFVNTKMTEIHTSIGHQHVINIRSKMTNEIIGDLIFKMYMEAVSNDIKPIYFGELVDSESEIDKLFPRS